MDRVSDWFRLRREHRLEKTFGRPFPATLTFNHPTIESLSEYLLVEVLHLAPATRMTAADGRARTDEPIAVVGLSCRFPGGAEDPDSYWGLLRDGIDASGDMPADRWDATSVFDPNPQYQCVLVWLTELPPNDDGGGYKVSVNEVSIYGY